MESYPFEKRGNYPHMKPADVAIWERFIEDFPNAYNYVQYDVPCGTGPEFDTLVAPDTGGHVEELYKKKIDVVAFKDDSITIIELKPNAGASAVGQIKQYKRLYKADYTPPAEPQMVIITDNISADAREFAKEEGVFVIVV